MIIETKYRDVPFEELDPACHNQLTITDREEFRRYWPKLRGQPVTIETPPDRGLHYGCPGPHYRKYNSMLLVCPQIAEIGD